MRTRASLAGASKSYKSLASRLAALHQGMGPRLQAAGEAERAAAYHQRVLRTYFGCGVAASLVIGCAALLPMVYAHPASDVGQVSVIKTDAGSAALAPRAKGRAPSIAEAFDVPVRYAERASAPFALQIVGIAPGESASVILRNVPEAVSLSRGERQDARTWLLRGTDLENLRLALGDAAPDTFEITVEVSSAASDQLARGVGRVRMLDRPAPAKIGADTAASDRAAVVIAGRADPKAATQRARQQAAIQRPADISKAKAAQKAAVLPVAKLPVAAAEETNAALPTTAGNVARVTRPDGMSALGAVAHDTSTEVRQLWWKMPLPSWAPFNQDAARN